MQRRTWVSVCGVALVLAVACGEPGFDGFESTRDSPGPSSTTPVPLGSASRAGAGGTGGAPRPSVSGGRGGTTISADGGRLPGAAGAAGQAEESSGGSATRPNGGQNGQGGRRAASGGVASGTGGDSIPLGGSAGEPALPPVANAGGAGGAVELEPPPSGAGGAATGPEASGGSTGGTVTTSSGGSPPEEPPEPLPRTLLISEYAEGSTGNKKALELAALVEETLLGCEVEVFANGALDPSASWSLDGSVTPETPYLLCTKELQAALAEVTCTREVALTFNGDDAVVLRCGDQIVDVLGQVGTRPDKQWGAGDSRTADMTLRRACSVQAGDPLESDAFDPSLEWIPAGADEFSDLGQHCAGAQ
jgi:hypothetical protein